MKKLLIISITIIFYSCESKNVSKNSTDIIIDGSHISTYIIDSCEYIGNVYNGSASYLSHKGNCKFCLKRK